MFIKVSSDWSMFIILASDWSIFIILSSDWSGRDASTTRTLQTVRRGEWCPHLQAGAGLTITRNLDKVYMCEESLTDFSVSCYILNRETNGWEKLFTTDLNTDQVIMLSLSTDERYLGQLTDHLHRLPPKYSKMVHWNSLQWVQTLASEWKEDKKVCTASWSKEC